MKFAFRPELTVEVKSYAVNTPHVTESTLDCSQGVNPYGYPEAAAEALKSFDVSHLFSYPHSGELFDAVIEYWKDIADIKSDEISFCNGTIAGLYTINNIFSGAERKDVVGFIPSFTDMIESVRNFGMHYKPVPIRMEENGKQVIGDIIEAIDDNTAFVYLDRPNNPTGQTLSLAEIEDAAKATLEKGAYLLVDEAYGDFIPKDESALSLRGKYDNLIIVRTFSKGFGLANLRGGYIVAPADVILLLSRTGNPYVLSDLHREVFAAALKHPETTTGHGEEFGACKAAIKSCIGKRINMLETDSRVPICTLKLNEPGDLQALLLNRDVLAVSGKEFDLLDESYVRLRVPTLEHVDRLVKAVSLVEQGQ